MARSLRTTFAAPLVVTLAVAPACVVHSAPPATNPPPSPGTPAPPSNPPDPTPQQTEPAPPVTAGPLGSTWTVYQRDGVCVASIDVQCKPGATCNPPAPQPMTACPPAMAAGSQVRIVETSPSVCEVQYPAPTGCDPRVCNPPRPQAVECPR